VNQASVSSALGAAFFAVVVVFLAVVEAGFFAGAFFSPVAV